VAKYFVPGKVKFYNKIGICEFGVEKLCWRGKVLFSSNFYTLKAALDAAMLRQSVHAQNIANAETPGYRRKYVVFEENLREAMKLRLLRTNEKHITSRIAFPAPEVRQEEGIAYRNDENGVDIDYEVVQMVSNGLKYQVMSRLMSMSFERYNTVLRGG